MEHSNETAKDRVVADLKSLVRDSEEMLKATAHDVSDKAREARERLSAALARANATCKDIQEQTTAKAKAAAEKANTAVHAHPYESIGIGFGVGLLIGVLVGGRK